MKRRHWKDIEREANATLTQYLQLKKQLGLDAVLTPPIPVREIAFFMRLSVNPVHDLRYDGRKLAGMLESKERSISFEARDILGRQNFSIAHEIGHYKLHWLPSQPSTMTPLLFPLNEFSEDVVTVHFRCTHQDEDLEVQLRSEGRFIDEEIVIQQTTHKYREEEANIFASFILMPSDLVRDWVKRLKGDLDRLAYQFEVSGTAMNFRLERLRLKTARDKSNLQEYFFVSLPIISNPDDSPEGTSEEETSSGPIDPTSVFISSDSRLRTLVSQVNAIRRNSDSITLDFDLFKKGKLESVGVTQALELVLLNDYILDHLIPLYTISTDTVDIMVNLPDPNSYMSRHLFRLGVFEYFRLGDNAQLPPSLQSEPDTASLKGSRILLPVTKIEDQDNIEEKIQGCVSDFLNWAGRQSKLVDLTNSIERVVVELAQNVIRHSGTQPDCGKGYAVIQGDRIWQDDQLQGFQVTIAVGDIGIGVKTNLVARNGYNFDTDFDALLRYLEGPTLSRLKTDITKIWLGHVQLNSGDTLLSAGLAGTSYIKDLSPVPGLQVTVLLNCYL